MRTLVIATALIVACDGTREVSEHPSVRPQPATSAAQHPPGSPAPGSSAQEPLRAGGEVLPPVLVRRVDPVYPDYPGTYSQGILLLECVITSEGDVRDLRVIKGPGNSFEQAILDAVVKWKFKPGSLHGKPVAVIYNLSVNHVPYGPRG